VFWDVAPGGVRRVLQRFAVGQGDLAERKGRYLGGLAAARAACGGLGVGGYDAAGGQVAAALTSFSDRADAQLTRMEDQSSASGGSAELATAAYVEGDGEMDLNARQRQAAHADPIPFRLSPGAGGGDRPV
jgi:hypothetical protein